MRRKKLTIALGILAVVTGIAGFSFWNPVSYSNDLSLKTSADRTALQVGEQFTVRVYITNNGSKTVTLVNPGDGSESGWRTPVTNWSMARLEKAEEESSEV